MARVYWTDNRIATTCDTVKKLILAQRHLIWVQNAKKATAEELGQKTMLAKDFSWINDAPEGLLHVFSMQQWLEENIKTAAIQFEWTSTLIAQPPDRYDAAHGIVEFRMTLDTAVLARAKCRFHKHNYDNEFVQFILLLCRVREKAVILPEALRRVLLECTTETQASFLLPGIARSLGWKKAERTPNITKEAKNVTNQYKLDLTELSKTLKISKAIPSSVRSPIVEIA